METNKERMTAKMEPRQKRMEAKMDAWLEEMKVW
jgi:hypothetical protein